MPILTPIEAQRFDNKTQLDPETGCINWTGAIKAGGYGCVSLKRKLYYVHRIAYERANGPIPAGKVIDHRCHNRRCVNPAHLQIATTKENAENLSWVGSSTGYRGVTYHKKDKRFRVAVGHNGRTYTGGGHATAEEANAAAIALRTKLYTNNLIDRCEEVAKATK